MYIANNSLFADLSSFIQFAQGNGVINVHCK